MDAAWLDRTILTEAHMWRSAPLSVLLLLALIVAGSIEALGIRVAFTMGALLVFGAAGWLQLLRPDERLALLRTSAVAQ